MPILLFLIDTSASMNQRTYLGTTYLDIAKGAVETFMKLRARDPASRGDRYMLITFEEPPYCIKAGWKENHATFMNELKNLQAVGLTTLGHSLRTAFDLLNLNRLVSGIDNYGQGRNPFFLEPAVVVTITDGQKLTSNSNAQNELHLPLTSPLPGSELTREPFRWDQRLFALVLRLPGAASVEQEHLVGVPSDESPITAMCEVTGGRSYSVFTQKMLNQCLESLSQKVQSGVVIHFEKVGAESKSEGTWSDALRTLSSSGSLPWHSCHKLIYVRPNHKTGVPVGHWPIPESFWPDQNSPTLPPRTAHPIVKFTCVDSDPMVIDKFPFDKYELEPSPLTQFILERKAPHVCWQVYISNSGKYSDLGHPFGYLKASTTLSCVNLFVMPYNYPVLFPLVDDLFKVHNLKPDLKWRQLFENYLKSMPPYYLGPLKKALRMMGAANLIADAVEYGLSYSIISYLKKLSQQAKIESERVITAVGNKPVQDNGIKVKKRSKAVVQRKCKDFRKLLCGITDDIPLRLLDITMKEFAGFHIAILNKNLKPQTFKNPYDVQRSSLVDHLTRMRCNLLRTTRNILRGQDEDNMHSVPIAQMGNYQEYLKHIPSPLRELDPDQPKRLHTFGNPFKLDKKGMMIDEADEFVSGLQSKSKRPGEPNMHGINKRRRCMSPLLRGRLQATPAITNNIGEKDSPPKIVAEVQAELIRPIPVRKVADTRQDDLADNIVQNHIADLTPVLEPEIVLSVAYETSEQAINHIDELPGNHLLTNNFFISSSDEDDEEPRGRELNYGDNMKQSSNRGEKMMMDCRYYKEVNTEIRVQILKEIRKPGRKYQRIFSLVQQIEGTLQTRLIFLQNIIKEAARFKKRVLIEQLQSFLEELHRRSNQMNHLDSR
ncbi:integrator complex subunit 6 [Protopterus annectens]|uniref:integrator complex subunit 6 n=1 Tax=Protopterus annectens TaxID=7888 RepID=UPI001CF97214|nr:integrator complex subunit 6 [Protopterus annectens]